MTRPAFHFLVDVFLFIAFVAHLWAATLVQFIFPKGTEAGGWSVWRLDYNAWSLVSFGSLMLFTLLTLLHLILQWRWVCNFIVSRWAKRTGRKIEMHDGIKTIYGVGTLIGVLTLIGLLLAIAEIQVVGPAMTAQ
ncbi:MAG: hypothetical protein DHS20C16_31640 [Phycisphaerae bacterium]|nr:MAG: hypothetical protein DHS20C16_31640 [Phycisphaerae bacterium]